MSEKSVFPLNKAIELLKNYSDAQNEWLKRNREDIEIHCHKGCSFCCNISVKISVPEALILLNHADKAPIDKIRNQADTIRELWRECNGDEGRYFETYRNSPGSCAFLSPEGSCAIHQIRPLPCRQTLSGLPGQFCSRNISSLYSEDQIQEALNGLNRDFFTSTPYLVPMLDLGELYEYEMKLVSKEIFGVSYEGVMPVLLDNLIKHGLSGLRYINEAHFLMKEN